MQAAAANAVKVIAAVFIAVRRNVAQAVLFLKPQTFMDRLRSLLLFDNKSVIIL
jgi:hypothetical protein